MNADQNAFRPGRGAVVSKYVNHNPVTSRYNPRYVETLQRAVFPSRCLAHKAARVIHIGTTGSRSILPARTPNPRAKQFFRVAIPSRLNCQGTKCVAPGAHDRVLAA